MKKGFFVVFVLSALLVLSTYGLSPAKTLSKSRPTVTAAKVVGITVVKSPRKGEVWMKNHSYTVRWEKSGRSNARVNIGLYDVRGKVRKLVIAGRVPDSGSYRWKIPSSARPGSYLVIVENEKNHPVAKSAVFSIREVRGKDSGKTAAASGVSAGAGVVGKPKVTVVMKPGHRAGAKPGPASPVHVPPLVMRSRTSSGKGAARGAVSVSHPSRGEKWYQTRAYDIQWKKSGRLNARVNISLYDPRGRVKKFAVASRVSDNGSYRWKIPSTVTPGQYIVAVEDVDMNLTARSAVFSVREKGKINLKAAANNRMKQAAAAPTNQNNSETETPNHNLPDLAIENIRVNMNNKSADGLVHVRKFFPIAIQFCIVNHGRPMGEGRPAKFRYSFDTATDVCNNVPELRFDIEAYNGDELMRVLMCQPGTHTLTLTIDSENWIEEANEENNTASVTFFVDPAPRLALYVDSNINRGVGVDIPVHAHLKNIGDAASKSCELKFYLKKGGTRTFTVPPLQPGQKFIATRKHRYHSRGFKKITAEIVGTSLRVETHLFVRLPTDTNPSSQKGYRYCRRPGSCYCDEYNQLEIGYCDEIPDH